MSTVTGASRSHREGARDVTDSVLENCVSHPVVSLVAIGSFSLFADSGSDDAG
jgi:hypothetical protein